MSCQARKSVFDANVAPPVGPRLAAGGEAYYAVRKSPELRYSLGPAL